MNPLRVMRLQELGCLACRKNGRFMLPELHHPTEGGRRIGGDVVVPLCPWHHRGVLPQGFLTTTAATEVMGPSFAKSRRLFEATYGTEQELIAETERMMARYD